MSPQISTIEEYRAWCASLAIAVGDAVLPPEVVKVVCQRCGRKVATIVGSEPWPMFVGLVRRPDGWRGGLFDPVGNPLKVQQIFRVLLGHTFQHPEARCIGACSKHGLVEIDPSVALRWAKGALAQGGRVVVQRVQCANVDSNNVFGRS